MIMHSFVLSKESPLCIDEMLVFPPHWVPEILYWPLMEMSRFHRKHLPSLIKQMMVMNYNLNCYLWKWPTKWDTRDILRSDKGNMTLKQTSKALGNNINWLLLLFKVLKFTILNFITHQYIGNVIPWT